MRKVILYRACNNLRDDEIEIQALKDAGFVYLKSRFEIQKDDLVIARYSCVPFYNELVYDLSLIGANLINSFEQHNYIADLANYVVDLKELTFKTWDRLEDLPDDASFVIKGATNSRKSDWIGSMFAKNKQEAIKIYFKLLDDSLIGRQTIYIREYVPLYTYMIGVGGLPITKEFRFFICDNKILCGNFYWSSHAEDLKDLLGKLPSTEEIPKKFLHEVMRRISMNVHAPRAYVLDVATTASGEPIVVEINDLQTSGLSENDPFVFYSELMRVLLGKESTNS